MVPEGAALRFNPPRVSFLWLEPVHANEVRVMAERGADGQVVLYRNVADGFRRKVGQLTASHRP